MSKPIGQSNIIFPEQVDPMSRKALNQVIYKPVSGVVSGTNAGTTTFYGTFFVSDKGYWVTGISEVHNVAGTDAGTVTVTVQKIPSGTLNGAGNVLLATAFSLKATATIPQFGTLTKTTNDLILRKSDRLSLTTSGTLTAVSDVCVTVNLLEI